MTMESSGSSMQKGPADQGNQSIGVFLCKCRGEISNRLNIESISQAISMLPFVRFVSIHEALCSPQGCAHLRNECKKHSPSRVIIGACSPETAETPLGPVLEEAGLNKYLCSQVDMREQCAWVHPQRDAASEKAISLLRGGVLSLFKREPLQDLEFHILPVALVIGAEPAGAQVALDISEAGFKVYLVDVPRTSGEGDHDGGIQSMGMECDICSARYAKECRVSTPKLIDLGQQKNIEIISECKIEEIGGIYGRRYVKTQSSQQIKEFEAGTVLVAVAPQTGIPGHLSELVRSNPDIVTSWDFEKLLNDAEEKKPIHTRSDNRPLTSVSFFRCTTPEASSGADAPRGLVCHGLALHQARRLKQLSPGTEVDLYIYEQGRQSEEIKTLQDFAVQEGIRLTRMEFPTEIKSTDGRISIRGTDLESGTPIDRTCDMIVVPMNQTSSDATEGIIKMLHATRGINNGPAGPSTVSAATLYRGMCVLDFSIGAFGPARAVEDGRSAAAQMIELMRKGIAHEPRIVARVDEYRCRGCGRCKKVCDFDAISLVEKEKGEQVAKIDELRCEGCGLCRVACCNGSMALLGYTTTQLLAEMLGIIGEGD